MQEVTLTWSLWRNSLPLPALRARAPSGPMALGRFIFRDIFLYRSSIIFDGFRFPLWLHVGVIFRVVCITFSSIDFTWNCCQFCKEMYTIVGVFLLIFMVLNLCNCWSIFVVFHGTTSNWRNPHFFLFLHNFCIVYTFANTCLFHNFRDMFRCSLLHHLLLYVSPMLESFWYDLGNKT